MTNPLSYALKQKDRISFFEEVERFLENTLEYVHLGINPGDYYKGVWARDAAFILKDQFLTGDTYNVLRALYFIWDHQIDPGDNQRIIYGRGSPELGFSFRNADSETRHRFKGALPSTIYRSQGLSEVYASNPDIDSTALMISTTSWILDVYLKAGLYSYYQNLSEWASALAPRGQSMPPSEPTGPLSSSDYNKQQLFHSNEQAEQSPLTREEVAATSKVISRPEELIEFIVPRMLAAVDYLTSRDIDNDGLLEQGCNEDWMDTALRAGKIVYSQATWILALSDLSSLLYEIGKESAARRLTAMAERAMRAVEEKLWSEEDGTYIDLRLDGNGHSASTGSDNNRYHHDGKMLTQDVSLYLVSVTENTLNDILSERFKSSGNEVADGNGRKEDKISREKTQGDDWRQGKIRPRIPHGAMGQRAASTLETIKKRAWMDSAWPLVTERALKTTGPWVLDPHQYHNHTFWPWITGIEMLARSRFQRYQECNELLTALVRGDHPQTLAFYEWVNPKTGKGDGAFPFRTGISALRIAMTDVLLSHV